MRAVSAPLVTRGQAVRTAARNAQGALQALAALSSDSEASCWRRDASCQGGERRLLYLLAKMSATAAPMKPKNGALAGQRSLILRV